LLVILEARAELDPSLRADHIPMIDGRGAETAREARQAVFRKTHRHGNGFGHLGKSLFAVISGEGHHFDRLLAKAVTRCVDSVNAHIQQRAARKVLFEARIAFLDLLAKNGVEDTRLANLARSDQRDDLEVGWFEMQP